MRNAKRSLFVVGLGLFVVLIFNTGWFSRAGARGPRGKRAYEVTVTNITRGQIISPPVVAVHNRRMEPLFTLGSSASEELAFVAEDAVNGPLIESLSEDSNVGAVGTITGMKGPIFPGETASTVVEAHPGFRRFTLVGMLVTTNDAFFAVNGVRGNWVGSATYFSPAYDAGPTHFSR